MQPDGVFMEKTTERVTSVHAAWLSLADSQAGG
jgi:hypothetical protein